MLSDGSGLDVCREVRRESKVPIIMLTARGDETDRVVGLELGADDYVVKPFSARELVARIRAVLRRVPDDAGGNAAAEELRVGGLTVDTAMRRAALDGEELTLTRREFDLLAILVRNAGTVLTRERLIDEVWDTNWFGSTKTLDVHVSSLRRKLGDDAVDSRYLHTVRGVGFGFAAPGRVRRMTYRGRLLAAFAYVLVLVIVALTVPLALSTERRIDREVRAQAADGAQLAAASASGRLDRTGELDALARRVDAEIGARVIIVGAHGRPADRLRAPGHARHRLRRPARDRGGSGRAHGAGPQALRHARRGAALHGRPGHQRRAHRRRGAHDAERRRDRPRDAPRPVRADRRRGARAAVRARRDLVRRRLAVASAAPAGDDRRGGSAAAISRRVRTSRDRPSRQEVAQAFNTMADRLTHSLDAQREFVANASHQLRTPLTGLRLRVEAASMATDDPGVQAGAGGRGGRDVAAGAADHEPAHAGFGGRAGAAEPRPSTSPPPRARRRSAGARAPSARAGRSPRARRRRRRAWAAPTTSRRASTI